jgi:trehalose 6-phosphate phosphatase
MLRPVSAIAAELLEPLVAAPEETGIFLDFDGVLAPIVTRAEDAAVPAETRAELDRLVSRYKLVSVVSGRVGEDVRARVDVDGVVFVGSHGLELDPAAESFRDQIRDFAATAPWPPDRTELKGLSVAFHFRGAEDAGAALRELELLAERALDEGLAPRFGRMVMEVLPPTGSNKGTAVRQLLEQARLTRALVAGDDTTDIDAFRALAGLAYAVRVAVVSEESPSVLRDEADIVLGSTDEFLELLRRL